MPSLVNINSISPDLRDILLGMNLKPSKHIVDNTYTQFLNTHTPIGNPYTIAYKNTVTQGKSLKFLADTVYRQFNYVANKYEGEGTDYEDVGARITNVILPNSSGNKPYDVKGFTDTFPGWDKDNIFVTVPSSPYTYNPYKSPKEAFNFNIIKNIKFKPSANKEKDYSLTYFKAKPAEAALKPAFDSEGNQYGPYFNLNKYKGIPTDISYVANSLNKTLNNNTGTEPYDVVAKSYTVPNIYNSTPTSPFTDITDSSIKNNSVPYIFNSNISEFRTVYQYGLGIFKAKPADAALTLTYDDKGILYGPNFNLNKYVPPLTDSVYVGSSLDFKVPITTQKGSYLNENGKLNVEGTPSDDALGTLSSLINGGVGINTNGVGGLSVVDNIDVRNSIVGRALTAGGKDDTDLGIIAGERLAISLANNAVFKAQKETIGKVNLDLFSYFDNNSSNNKFIKPNYEITVIGGGILGTIGKAFDFLGDLAGFTLPISQMKTEFFSFDDKLKPTLIGNIARANGMIETTGKGQVLALFRNMNANINNSNFIKQGYSPGFESRANILFDSNDAPKFNVYAYGDSNSGEILENTEYGNGRWTDTDGSGFEGEYFRYITNGNGGNNGNGSSGTESDFIWADENINIDENGSNTLIADADEIFGDSPSDDEENSQNQTNRKSILYKTKELFKRGGVQSMVNGHVTITEQSQIQTSVLPNGMMSKGNAALTKAALNGEFDDKTNIYCRTWTPMDKYDQVLDLARHSRLNPQGGDYVRNKNLLEYSVLEDTGFVKIASYLKDTNESPKRYMFSIENLAWKDNNIDLPKCEIGPNGGRIMWFPPYDINFSESMSINWDKHNFIGRGEPMYTYNNTERTGQLSFKIIIDHPNTINNKTNNVTETDQHYASFFAGCNLEDIIPTSKIEQVKKTRTKTFTQEVQEEPKIPVVPPKFNIFFPNDNYEYPYNNPEYESGLADSASLANIRTIVKTVNDGTEYITPPRDWNLLMGTVKGTFANPGTKLYGPVNPLTITAADYKLKKINDDNLKGEYYGLGMTVNDVMTLSTQTDRYIDRTNFGLNANRFDAEETNKHLTIPSNDEFKGIRWAGWLAANDMDGKTDMSYLAALKKHMNHIDGPCKDCVIEISGFASVQGNSNALKGKDAQKRKTEKEEKNKLLSERRANNIVKYFKEQILDPKDPKYDTRITGKVVGKGETDEFGSAFGGAKCTNSMDQDVLPCKLDRRVRVEFKYNQPPRLKKEVSPDNTSIIETYYEYVEEDIANTLKKRYEECSYFAKIAKNDPFTYKKLIDKIKFFSPAFHSTSPEGFNARLTFLQQCTRQGPSKYTQSEKPDNLVFGRPPVCVLRVGDFYYTKIIIESMSIDYEPLVWDLNPEGVGVQPMIANVSMNFSFIGGSSLDGPISKLQNSISSNYYANTGLFDIRADTNGAKYEAPAAVETEDPNSLYEDVQQTTTILATDEALTSKEVDISILNEGVLSVEYDDSGIFQGKVNGKFTIKGALSKNYSVKLRTSVPNNNNGVSILSQEDIDIGTLKAGELKINFKSKSKTTNSLQPWDDYFTLAQTNNDSGYAFYKKVQQDLEDYVQGKTVDEYDMTGNEADGWDYIKNNLANEKDEFINNFDFYVEIDELDFSKQYLARWTPIFKVKKNSEVSQSTYFDSFGLGLPYPEQKEKFTYTFTSYLSGGKLGMVKAYGKDENTKYMTTDELKAELKDNVKEKEKELKEEKQKEKEVKNKLKQSEREENKKARSVTREARKTLRAQKKAEEAEFRRDLQ